MTGGRWSSQTRFTVVLVGLALVALGVLTTMQFRSTAGAAALVAAGVLVGLAGLSGGTIVVRSTDREERLASAGKAQLEGDAEGAYDRFVQLIRGHAPQAIAYHEGANAALYEAAGREGQKLQPVFGYFLGPIAMSESHIIVDIRAGTGFSIARMQSTYQALLVGQTAAFQAALVIVNASPDDSILSSVRQLSIALDRPVMAVAWRLGDASDGISDAIVSLKRELRRRGLESPIEVPDVVLSPAGNGPAGNAPADRFVPERFSPDSFEPEPDPYVDDEIFEPQPVRIPSRPEPHRQAPPPPPAPRPPVMRPPAPGFGTAAPVFGPPAGAGSAAIPAQHARTDPEPEPDPEQWPNPEPRRRPSPAPRVYDDSASWQRATDLHWRGQLQEAKEAYGEIVDARAHALGWDHPDTLTARDQHATVLRDLDRLAEALVECDEVLTARMRILGEDHPDTLTSRSHLATIYHQLGDLTRSEGEHQRVLEARTRVLGSNHQETLISRSNLAKVYQDMGELDRAIDEHSTVMRARARLLGPEHRDTLMSRSLLASALHHAGRLPEAEAEHRAVLGSRLHLLGPVHLDTAVSRHRLASVLHDLGRLDEAVTEYRAAQSVYAQLLGANSPFARAAASDLALAERAARGAQGSRY
ncbi:tetratricopeptide repeat protein [Dactylosporangium aurantiacum]|uniref:Tetratricopeptide repeat protein n=1 Tax=Dactylosporangium aurantiacum TaxID=35754 RepID=A0A9Q9IMB0_9ACTN|nr:tetratricopeptide repeat protein [Dactylosporangium aurantiacum]MDG6104918.1 tetratricopeptide repeat protein [Dactylosporangium aurantiacum]UWZ55545.1 tetratricopeptide repeat protein [Dactylosporangium aurantiacum]